MSDRPDTVLVVGGGIAGMACAITAARRGVAVEVAERFGPAAAVGIGITHAANVLRVLRDLGVLDECIEQGAPFSRWVFTDANGDNRRYVEMARLAGDDKPAMMGMTRPCFAQILTAAAERAGVRIRPFTTIASLAQDADGVDVEFSDQSRHRYRAVIGADGIHSSIRQMVFGEMGAPRYTGQSVWRVFMPRSVDDLWLCNSGRGDKAGFVPLSKDLMYLYLTDTSPTREEPTDLAQTLYEKLKVFGGPVGECREQFVRDGRDILWRTFDFVDLPPPWFRGRVAVIGDAAHATTAHLGQGGAMAIEDGFVIGEELARHNSIGAAYSAFMERRFNRVNAIQGWSRQICKWEQENDPDADAAGLTAKAFELACQPI